MTKGQHIIELLKTVANRGYWGIAIREVVHGDEAPKVMDLIIELRSQGKDQPEILREILGDECFQAVMAI